MNQGRFLSSADSDASRIIIKLKWLHHQILTEIKLPCGKFKCGSHHTPIWLLNYSKGLGKGPSQSPDKEHNSFPIMSNKDTCRNLSVAAQQFGYASICVWACVETALCYDHSLMFQRKVCSVLWWQFSTHFRISTTECSGTYFQVCTDNCVVCYFN